MAIDLGTKLSISWAAFDRRTIGLTSQRTPLVMKQYELPYATGAGARQFTKCYAATHVLPEGGGAGDLDLTGVLTDVFGSVLGSARVKAWGIANTSADEDLTIGGTGGSNWTTCLDGTITLPPGAVLALATPDTAGWTVTASTGDLLHVAGTAGETYEIVLWIAET